MLGVCLMMNICIFLENATHCEVVISQQEERGKAAGLLLLPCHTCLD